MEQQGRTKIIHYYDRESQRILCGLADPDGALDHPQPGELRGLQRVAPRAPSAARRAEAGRRDGRVSRRAGHALIRDRTVSTGIVDSRTTRSATLPMSACAKPRRP